MLDNAYGKQRMIDRTLRVPSLPSALCVGMLAACGLACSPAVVIVLLFDKYICDPLGKGNLFVRLAAFCFFGGATLTDHVSSQKCLGAECVKQTRRGGGHGFR